MKKRIKRLNVIITVALGCIIYIAISGYREGPAYAGYDCTGAESGLGNPTGCYYNSGCHSASPTSNILIALELDSAGTPVTHYKGGASYTVKISGTNNTTSNLPRYGFQVGCIKGAVAQPTPVNAGTWPSPYPAGVHYEAAQPLYYVVNIVEHDTWLAPTTGTGSTGSTYIESIKWTAPASGTGTVSFWGVINCVNYDGSADVQDLWNTTSLVINEYPAGVDNVAVNNEVKVYPNPFSLKATFSLNNEVKDASLSLYDITGREVKQLAFSGKEVSIDREGLNTGIYFYRISTADKAITGKVIIE